MEASDDLEDVYGGVVEDVWSLSISKSTGHHIGVLSRIGNVHSSRKLKFL